MKFTNTMAAELFWVFGRNEGTNKKIRKHQSLFKANTEITEIIKV